MTSALETIDRVGTRAEVAAIAAQLGRFLVFAREYEPAAAHLERALTLAEELRLPETLAHALNSKAVMMLYRGRDREASILVRGALAVALEHDLHDAALRAYNNVIAQYWYEARFREGLALGDEALEYARRMGERSWELVFTIGRIGALDLLGRWDEALETAAAAEPYATTEFHRGLLLWAAAIHIRRGDRFACTRAGRSACLGRTVGQHRVRNRFRRNRGARLRGRGAVRRRLPIGAPDSAGRGGGRLVAVLRGRRGRPSAPRRRVRPQRCSHGSRMRHAGKRWRVVDAQLARLRARFPEHDAVAELEAAERMFRDLEAPFYVAAVQAERAEHLRAAGRADEAEQLVAEARETFERLGARAVPGALGRERAVA